MVQISNRRLYYLHLPSCCAYPKLEKRALEMLSAEKHLRLTRYTHKPEYERSLFGDLLVRTILSGLTGIAPETLHFSAGAYGKPFIKTQPKICFNLSHSGDYAVCAVSAAECGTDVEMIRRVRHDFAGRMFHPQETAFLNSLPAKLTAEYVCRIWTLKEAYVKFLGTGLRDPVSAFSFVGQHHQFFSHDFAPELCFSQFCLSDGYILSVCGTESFGEPIRIEPEELLAQSGI